MFNCFPSMRTVFFRLCLIACVGVASGCGVAAPSAPPTPIPTCVSTVALNPYSSYYPPNHVTELYALYKNGSVTYQNARQDAFSQLGEYTRRLSDYKDVDDQKGHMIRIVITYLDPILIQYIMLNYALSQQTPMDSGSFEAEVQQVLQRFEQRNELLFMMLINSPLYGQPSAVGRAVNLKMPVEALVFVNTSGVQVSPTRYDHVLAENIDVLHGPVYGVVGYPIALVRDDTCAGIIDPWMTSLTLDMKELSFADQSFYSLFWNIPFKALITQDEYHPTPTLDVFFDVNRYGKLTAPPTPGWQPVVTTPVPDINWKAYWDDMGRYLWNVVITEYGH